MRLPASPGAAKTLRQQCPIEPVLDQGQSPPASAAASARSRRHRP
jgi:hypothetical protein